MSDESSASAKWTRIDIRALIEMYKGFPVLWDVSHAENKSRKSKVTAFNKLHTQFEIIKNVSKDALQAKIHSLRTIYQKEHKKVQTSMRSGMGSEDIHIPKLWFYDLMSFINNGSQERTSASNIEYENNFKCNGLQDTKVTIQCVQNIEPVSQSVTDENSLVYVQNIVPMSKSVEYENSLQSTSEAIEYICIENLKCKPMLHSVTHENALQSSVQAIASPVVPKCSQPTTTPRKSKHRRVERAAMNNKNMLATPSRPHDEYSTQGESWTYRLRGQMEKNPTQGLIAQRLIAEVFFLSSFDKLTIDSKVV